MKISQRLSLSLTGARRIKQKGQVLILTLLILAILSLLSLSFSYRMRLEIDLTSAKRDYLKALYLAKAGVYYALEKERRGNHFSGSRIELSDGSFSYTIESEEGKIDINTAKEDLLREIPGLDRKIVQAILKARAERKFSFLEELLLVKGITPYLLWGEDTNGNGLLDPSEDDGWLSPPQDNQDGELSLGLAKFVTVYSNGLIDINEAGPEVLDLLPEIDEGMAHALIEHREETPFKEVDEINLIRKISPAGYSKLKPLITTKSHNLKIISTGQIGRIKRRVEAAINKEAGKIRYLRED